MYRARLLAMAQKERGAWPNAFPVSSLGTLLDSETFRVIASEVGGWTVEVCMAYPAKTVLAAFHGIRQ